MTMLPPPVGQFASRNELIAHVQTFAHTQGYATTIKRSVDDIKVLFLALTVLALKLGYYLGMANMRSEWELSMSIKKFTETYNRL